jgi:hypothetical protein
MKTIILAALSMAALSCASPTRQVVSPRGSDVDNWTDEATHDWRVKNWNAKVGKYVKMDYMDTVYCSITSNYPSNDGYLAMAKSWAMDHYTDCVPYYGDLHMYRSVLLHDARG